MKYLFNVINFILLVFTVTSSIEAEAKSVCLTNLKTEMKSNWERPNEKRDYCRTSKKFVTRLDSVYRNCIIGLSKTEFISLFGKPTGTGVDRTDKRYSGFLRYTINFTCSEQNNPSCPQILFSISGDTVIADFWIIYTGLYDFYFASTKKCIKELSQSAKINWVYHSDVNRYEAKDDFISRLEGSRSWITNEITDKQILQILGPPSKVDSGGSLRFDYLLYPCENENKMIEEKGFGCITYTFAFSIFNHKLYGYTASYLIRSYQQD